MKITVSFETDATTEDQAKAIVAHLVDFAPPTLWLDGGDSATGYVSGLSFSLSNITLVSVEQAAPVTEDAPTG